MRYAAIVFLALALFAPTAQGASFDCAKASTDIERTICADKELSALDEQLGESYAAARTRAVDRKALRSEQRAWIHKERDVCTATICLKAAYRWRIGKLKRYAAACNMEARIVLDSSTEIAVTLPNSDSGDISGYRDFNTLRTGYGQLLGDLVLAYAMAGCVPEAVRTLDRITQPTTRAATHADLAEELARQGRLAEADGLFRTLVVPPESSGYGIGEDTAFLLGRVYILAGNVARGNELIYSVEGRWNHYNSPLINIVEALVDADRFDEAIAEVDKAGRKQQQRNAWRIVESALITRGEKARADKLRSKYAEEKESSANVSWDAQSNAQQGDFANAVKKALSIEALPDRIGALINIANIAPSKADTRKTLGMAAELSLTCVHDGCKSSPTYVAESYVEAGLEKPALGLISKAYADDDLARNLALSKVAVILARRGKIKAAAQIDITIPNYRHLVQVALAIAYGKAGNFDSAFDIYRKINGLDKFRIAGAIATMPVPADAIPRWLEAADSIDDSSLRAGIYQVVLARLSRDGKAEKAEELLNPLNRDLMHARGLLGIAQGKLGIVPGEYLMKLMGTI